MNGLTRILIVLTMLFSVICATLVVFMVSKQENYKSQVDGANTAKIGLAADNLRLQGERDAARQQQADTQKLLDVARTELARVNATSAAAIATAQATQIRLEGQLAQEKATNTALSASLQSSSASVAKKDEELTLVRPKVAELTRQNSDLSRAKTEVDNQLRAAEMAIRKLQEELTLALAAPKVAGSVSPTAGGDGQVTSLIMTPSTTAVNARILQITTNPAGRIVFSVPLGTRDGLTTNAKLMISRNNKYIGEATLNNVGAESSAGTVTSTNAGETVQPGDVVTTVSGR